MSKRLIYDEHDNGPTLEEQFAELDNAQPESNGSKKKSPKPKKEKKEKKEKPESDGNSAKKIANIIIGVSGLLIVVVVLVTIWVSIAPTLKTGPEINTGIVGTVDKNDGSQGGSVSSSSGFGGITIGDTSIENTFRVVGRSHDLSITHLENIKVNTVKYQNQEMTAFDYETYVSDTKMKILADMEEIEKYKVAYVENDMMDLFKVNSARLQNAFDLYRAITPVMSNDALNDTINTHILKDGEMSAQAKTLIIKVLEKNNIKYDMVDGKITYKLND